MSQFEEFLDILPKKDREINSRTWWQINLVIHLSFFLLIFLSSYGTARMGDQHFGEILLENWLNTAGFLLLCYVINSLFNLLVACIPFRNFTFGSKYKQFFPITLVGLQALFFLLVIGIAGFEIITNL